MRMTKQAVINTIVKDCSLRITNPHDALIKLNQMLKYQNLNAKKLAKKFNMPMVAVKKLSID